MGVPTHRLKSVWDSISMLFLNDAIDTFQNSGLLPAIKALGAGFVGVGVQSYKERAFSQLQKLEDDLAMGMYGVKWDKITPSQAKEIKQLPEYKEMVIKKEQERVVESFNFSQPEALLKAGKRIYGGLGDYAGDVLLGVGIKTISMSDKVQGVKLNKERMDLYEELVIENVQSDLGDILDAADSGDRDEAMKQINKSKERAREALVEFIESGQI